MTTSGLEINKTATTDRSTIELLEATTTQAGGVSTSGQSWAGDKNIIDKFTAGSNLDVTATHGDVHAFFDAFGATLVVSTTSGPDTRAITLFSGGGPLPGAFNVTGTIEATSSIESGTYFICAGQNGSTGTLGERKLPIFEGGIKVGEANYTPPSGSLSHSHTISADDTWEDHSGDTGALAAGTYEFIANVRSRSKLTAGTDGDSGMIVFRFRRVMFGGDGSTDVFSDAFMSLQVTKANGTPPPEFQQGTGGGSYVAAVDAGDKVRLQFKRVTTVDAGAVTFGSTTIVSDGAGTSKMTWVRNN